jgi:ActR/RegA family two-component response regulator
MTETTVHILWADDQPDLLVEVRSRLAARGFSIATVENGIDAAAYIESNFPALLIVDIRMPPGDDGGLWLVEHVRKVLRSGITTIVLSGKGTRLEVAKAVRLGANYFVEKEAATDAIESDILQFLSKHNDEEHERAVVEIRDELDRFEKEARRHVQNIFSQEFGAHALPRLIEALEGSVPEEKLCRIKADAQDLASALEYTYLSNLEQLLLGKWHRLSRYFDKVGMQRGEFARRFDGVVAIRNRLSHANHVPIMELLRTRVFIYDISRALVASERGGATGTSIR